ncbi:MAG TPA: PQQ-dependent dehydrogenase, methanol/ethanol family, partial [Acetobacteraceae bacterium]|nr:PQQ-dependent dehydrogenase, methanol/ethanol family [Acetobacteraceae bacterium]
RIKAPNIGRLGLAWSLDLPGEVSLEGTPLAVNGVLYFTGTYAAVYAVDGASGKLLWKYDPQTWKVNPLKMLFSFAANRGAAYADGRVFAATLDGRLIALDAKTGKLLWSAQTVAPQGFQTITGAPHTFDGKVIIGNGGADMGQRGYVTAYDAATGQQAWRFYVTPGSPEQNKGDPAMERAAATWKGPYWKTGTGGGVWDSMTFDAGLNRIYIGTGNAGPYDPTKRSPGGGDNLYTASIVALDANTGKYVWHYQLNPRDEWDFDATQDMILADLTIDGKPRKVLMQAPKNGFFYVLDRETGKPISAGKFGKVTWADRIDMATGRPVEASGVRYDSGDVMVWPGPTGAHSWQAMAFSPKTGLAYIPYMQVGARFAHGPAGPGAVSVGGVSISSVKQDDADGKGALVAYDPVAQKTRWTAQHATLWNGGVLATAGGVVFQGTADGMFTAYDAVNGKRLWQFNAGLGIIAAPISYSAGGKQYVSVLVGYGGAAAIGSDMMNVGWKFGAQPRRLLTFALDGKATLPPSAPPDFTVHAVDDPALKLNPADVAAGHAMFIACAACHGRDLVSAGAPAPDLRESRIALDPASYRAVVLGGSLIEQGMPRFAIMGEKPIMAIWAYIRQGARDALAAEKKGEAPASTGKK